MGDFSNRKEAKEWLIRDIGDYFDSIDDNPHNGEVTREEALRHIDLDHLRSEVSKKRADRFMEAVDKTFADGQVITREEWIEVRNYAKRAREAFNDTVVPGVKQGWRTFKDIMENNVGPALEKGVNDGLNYAEREYLEGKTIKPDAPLKPAPQVERRSNDRDYLNDNRYPAKSNKTPIVPGSPAKRFAIADTDRSGTLDKNELQKFFYPPDDWELSDARMNNADTERPYARSEKKELPSVKEMAKYFGISEDKVKIPSAKSTSPSSQVDPETRRRIEDAINKKFPKGTAIIEPMDPTSLNKPKKETVKEAQTS